MYKKKAKIITILLLVFFNTSSHYNLFAMDATSLKNSIFLLYANSETSSAFIPSSSENSHDGGTFYEALQEEIQQKNQGDKKIQTEIIPFQYAEKFNNDMDFKKIDYAFQLAEKISNKINGGYKIFIFANGEGLNIAALATQLLNSKKTNLDYNGKRSFLHRAQDLTDFKEKMDINRGLLEFKEPIKVSRARDAKPQPEVTVINIKLDTSYQADPLFNQDFMIVNRVHHIEPGINRTTDLDEHNISYRVDTSQISRWDKLKSCCKKTIADPRTKAIAALCVKIVITALIAAL